MAREATWSYELAPGGEGPAGIEEYAVETSDGDRVGTVGAVVRHGADVYVLFGGGHHGPRHALRALEWRHVAAVDAGEAAIRLDVAAGDLDEAALELDAGKAVEGGPADAVRLTELPPELGRYPPQETAGPQDRPVALFLPALAVGGAVLLIVAIGLAAAGMVAAGVVIGIVAVGVLAVAVVLFLRLLRDPYVRRRAPRGPAPSPPTD